MVIDLYSQPRCRVANIHEILRRGKRFSVSSPTPSCVLNH